MKSYNVGDAHTLSGDDIVRTVKERDEIGQGGSVSGRSVRRAVADMSVVESFQLENWLGREDTARIVHSWNVEKLGGLGSSSNIKAYDGHHLLGGLRVGNVWIDVKKPLGIVGDPMRLLLERDLTPHPQYDELYR
jgi:magnesium chelatase subunit H